MARDVSDTTPIESRDQLVAWIEKGCKPKSAYRIGTEHEKFPFYRANHASVPYQGERGIRAILAGMQKSLGWEPILDDSNLIGLADGAGLGAISLEPGGQFELSGAPLEAVHDTETELKDHLTRLHAVARALDVSFLGLGHSPTWTRAETPVMPKNRYEIMRAYMPKVGTRGLDMMLRTSTVQVNLDFSSEADMVKKLKVSVALQPVATALFANSPFSEGRPNGYLSMRSEIWRDTDNQRAGMIPFVFENGMGFERYVDYALDVPLYFVKRGDTYHDVAGSSFRDLLAGKLTALPGERATMSDWVNHLGTLFPEVRLKRYLEMRGADCGLPAHILALPAFWVGLLYDQASLDAAYDMVKGWTTSERQALRDAVPKLALSAPFRGGIVNDLARQALDLSRAGLKQRARRDHHSFDETRYLAPLESFVERRRTAAEAWLEAYHERWGENIEPIFSEAEI